VQATNHSAKEKNKSFITWGLPASYQTR